MRTQELIDDAPRLKATERLQLVGVPIGEALGEDDECGCC